MDNHDRVMQMMAKNPEAKYAVASGNTEADPVLVTVGIRGLATFDMEIPHDKYDGMALLEMIERME